MSPVSSFSSSTAVSSYVLSYFTWPEAVLVQRPGAIGLSLLRCCRMILPSSVSSRTCAALWYRASRRYRAHDTPEHDIVLIDVVHLFVLPHERTPSSRGTSPESHLLRAFAVEGDGAASGGSPLANFLGKDAQNQPPVLQRGVIDVAAQVLLGHYVGSSKKRRVAARAG